MDLNAPIPIDPFYIVMALMAFIGAFAVFLAYSEKRKEK